MGVSSAKFISFEGGEGGGKTTQAKLLLQSLETAGITNTVHTREPGGEEGAEAIRELLVKGEPNRWDDIAETLLFLAARRQHVARLIQPALDAGKWVVSDRFHDSTRVYQGVGKGLSDDYYAKLHHMALGNVVPDLTIVLDMPAEEGIKRSFSRDNDETRFEEMDISFHEAVRQGFLDLAVSEPSRIMVVDASSSIDVVHHQICELVSKRFGISLGASV